MKIKLEEHLFHHGNLVLNFNNHLKDNNLKIFKLIKNCPQLHKNIIFNKKIEKVSDIIYIFIDRIYKGNNITKNFYINEEIYYNTISKKLTSKNKNKCILYELKFIIYYNENHYIAYSKIKNNWYIFDDLSNNEAKLAYPPLDNNQNNSEYLVILYYVKK